MRLRGNYYLADKGKHFVLTEKGKEHYENGVVSEAVEKYDIEAVSWKVDAGFLEEAPIPDWITKIGYEVVYDHAGYALSAGNHMIFPELEVAEKYMKNYQRKPWFDRDLYIRETVYEGKALKDCREYNGKKVYNKSWYYGTDALMIGDLVEEDIVDDLIDCLPPACMRKSCTQLGEPSNTRIDDAVGKERYTYETFKYVTDGIWEYCGDCFRGENVQRGKSINYV